MLNVLLDMLTLLAIIIVGFLILAVCAFVIYAILYVVYKFFIDKNGGGRGRR